jgi:hypothetical protein
MVIVVPIWTVRGLPRSKNNERLFGDLVLMPITPWSILLPLTGSCTPMTLFVTLITARLAPSQWNTISRGRDINHSRMWKRIVANRHEQGFLTFMPLKISLTFRARQKPVILEVHGWH